MLQAQRVASSAPRGASHAASVSRTTGRSRCAVRVAASAQQEAPEASRRSLMVASVSAAALPTLLAALPARADGGASLGAAGTAMGACASAARPRAWTAARPLWRRRQQGAFRGARLPLCSIPDPPPLAHAAEYAKFLGYATPPTSYGGYGGNANEAAK